MIEVIATDAHFPYHDRAAWRIVLEVVRALQPEIVWLGGDQLDMYPISHWDRDPQRKLSLQSDINVAREELVKVREAAPDARIYFKEGNHETRLTRYLSSKAEELIVLDDLKLHNLLKLGESEIEFVGNNERKRFGELHHLHGNEIKGGGMNPAYNKFRRVNANIIFGHHHQQNQFVARSYDGRELGAWSVACLCDLSPEYVHHAEMWTHGFAIVEYTPRGLFQVEQIPIVHPTARSAQAMVRGRVFKIDVKEEKKSGKRTTNKLSR